MENPTEIKRIKSNVEDYHDIEWEETDGKNPIIDSAIINDDLTATIEFQDKKYTVRSPDRRLTKKILALQGKSESKDGLTLEEKFLADGLQEKMVEDMIDGLSIDNHPNRISEIEYDNLAFLCWHYYEFSKKKSIGQRNASTS